MYKIIVLKKKMEKGVGVTIEVEIKQFKNIVYFYSLTKMILK